MKRSSLLSLFVMFLFVVLVAYWQRNLTYESEVNRFEASTRARVNAANVQSWATNLLTRYSSSNIADWESRSFEVQNIPPDIQRVNRLSPTAFLFANPASDKAYIRIGWGSGFRGHWGLDVGGLNFVDPCGDEAELWKPGIYFWRQHRYEHDKRGTGAPRNALDISPSTNGKVSNGGGLP